MEITVGIDVSKARLDVYVHPAGESFAMGNDEAGVQALVERLGQLEGLAWIGIEASGRYERLVVAQLAARGLPVVVLNPAPSALDDVAHAVLRGTAATVLPPLLGD